MTLGELIYNYRMQENISQREFARRCGLSNAIISKIEQGDEKKPVRQNVETYIKIARVIGMDLTKMFHLLGDNAYINLLPPNVISVNDLTLKSVPVIGKVAAGEPIYADENHTAVIPAPSKADYALEIVGESMAPTYLPGDIIYIREQPDVDYPGQVAVVLLDDEATVKHVYKQKDGLMLISDNPAYEPMLKAYADYSTIRILGKVCGFTRMYK